MKVFLKPYYGKLFEDNGVFRVDNGDNIFYEFDKKIKKHDVDLKTFDFYRNLADKFVFCDIPFFWELRAWWCLLLNTQRSILLCFESPLINPLSHHKIFFGLFKRIYTWNDTLIDGQKIRKLFVPTLSTNLNRKPVSFQKRNLLVLINANKSSPYPFRLISPFKHELYEERLQAINYFEEHIPGKFHLYGKGWNEPRKFSLWERIFKPKTHSSFQGAIPKKLNAKLDVLSQYKFCICFENCVADGYLTEKIIDCFKSHTVPIYYGTPNITNYVPKNCFIDFRDFKDHQDLLKFLLEMDELTYTGYIKRGMDYLKNNFDKYWSEERFMKTFLEAISSAQ